MEAGGLSGGPEGLAARAGAVADRNGGTAVFALLVAVLALGLGLRLYYAIHTANPTPDSHGYSLIAESLYADQRFGHSGDFRNASVEEPSNYSPGLPLLVSGVYYATAGVHPLAARLLLALIAWLALPLTYLLGRRLASPARGRAGPITGVVAALPLALYPILVDYSGMYMTEPLAVTGLVASVVALLWASEQAERRAWLLPGFLLGLTALVRPEYLAFGAVFAALALARAWRDRGGWRPGAVAATLVIVAFCLPILPWTVRNFVVFDRFVPLSTGGGKALFIGTYLPGDGNNDDTKAALLSRPAVRGFIHAAHPALPPSRYDSVFLDEILRELARRRHPGLDTDAALARMGRHNLSTYLGDDPGSYAEMFARKALNMWKNTAGGRGLPVMRRAGWLGFHRALVLLGLAGIVLLAARRRWEAVVLGSIVVGITLIGTLLLPSPRRTLILLPLICAAAALAAVWAAERSIAAARARGILRSPPAEP